MELRRRFGIRTVLVLTTATQLLAAAFGVLVLATPTPATAVQSVPYKVNFQGRLTDNSGNVLADGSYNVKFSFWTASSGGSSVWSENRIYGSPDRRISVQNGLFNIQFGDVTALTPALFDKVATGDLYLEVELPTPATASTTSPTWTELPMTPRQPLASAPYAFNSDTLDGLDSSALVQLTPAAQQSGSINVSGTVNSATGLTLGVAGPAGTTGTLLFRNSASAGTVTLQAGNTSSSYMLTLPTAQAVGTKILQNDGSGNLSWVAAGGCGDCVLNDSGATDATQTIAPTTDVTGLTIHQTSAGSPTKNIFAVTDSAGTTTYIRVDQAGALALGSQSGTINLTTGTNTFNLSSAADTTLAVTNSGAGVANLTVDGGVSIGASQTYKINGTQITSAALSNDSDLAKLATANTFAAKQTFSGTPTASTTDSLVQFGSAIASGSASGTYIGVNPTSFTGDFENFQVGGATRLKVSALGDLTGGATATGDPTGNASPVGNTSTSMTLSGASPTTTNFDVGNYIKIASTNCGGTGVSTCYAKITAKTVTVLTITPALSWANNTTVTEYHLPEIGGLDTSQALDNRYGRGYFIAGVATGNGTTYYNEDGIDSNLATFNLLSTNVTTLNLGSASTAVTVPGSLTVAGQSIVNGSGQINGAQLQSGTVANTALANSTFAVTAGTNLTTGGSASLGGSITLNVSNSPSFSGGVNIDTGQTYKINNTPIASTNLSDTASITLAGNTFNGNTQLVQTTAGGAFPALSGTNITSLDPSHLAQGSAAATLQSAAATALTITANAASTWSTSGANQLTLQSGSGTLSLGSTTAITAGGALSIDSNTTNALGIGTSANAKAITLGNTAATSLTAAAATVNINSGASGTINIGDEATTKTIDIGGVDNGGTDTINIGTNTTGADVITIGSTNASSAVILVGGISSVTNNIGVRIGGGANLTDTNQVNLVLDSSNTFAEATNQCSTTGPVNLGALYYNTNTQAIRTCVNGGWEDVMTTAGMGILAFGVVPDSGLDAGNWTSLNGVAKGPCKVSWASATSVSVAPCTAYSGGRKVVVSAATTVTLANFGNGNFYHICFASATGAPTTFPSGLGGAENINFPSPFNPSSPTLCLADVKTSASAISNIYDLRTFTNTTKEYVANNTTVAPLGGLVTNSGLTTNNGVVVTSSTAVGLLRGVVVAQSGVASSTVITTIIATAGPQWVRGAATGTINQWAQSLTGGANNGYATSATISATALANLGLIQRAADTACNATTNCEYSFPVRIQIR